MPKIKGSDRSTGEEFTSRNNLLRMPRCSNRRRFHQLLHPYQHNGWQYYQGQSVSQCGCACVPGEQGQADPLRFGVQDGDVFDDNRPHCEITRLFLGLMDLQIQCQSVAFQEWSLIM